MLRWLLVLGVTAGGFAVVWWLAETLGGLGHEASLTLAGFAGMLVGSPVSWWASQPIERGSPRRATATADDEDGVARGTATDRAEPEFPPPTAAAPVVPRRSPNKRRRRVVTVAVLATTALVAATIAVVVTSLGENGRGEGEAQAAPDYPFAPPGIVVSPDGQWLYVTVNVRVHMDSDGWQWLGALVAIDAQTRVVSAPFSFASGAGHGVVTPDGKQMYIALDHNGVANVFQLGANPIGIGGFDLPGQSPAADPGAGGAPVGHPRMALGPDGRSLYIADPSSTLIWPANAQKRSVGEAIELDEPPLDIAISPDGKRLYVAVDSRGSGEIVTIDTHSGAVRNGFTVVGVDPRAIAISRDGARLYVANHGSDTVSAIDTGTGRVVRQFRPGCGTKPAAVAVGRDANRVYVTCESTSVVAAMDGATGSTVGTPVHVGAWPSSMAVSPDGSRLYVTTVGATTIDVAAIDTATNTLAVPAFPAATWYNQ
jgi:YVTN family beta-propeller protein